MLSTLNLSFYPYLNYSSIWNGIPRQQTSLTPAWLWSPATRLTLNGNLDVTDQLTANGWQRLDDEHWKSPQFDRNRHLRLLSQLADVRLIEMPGQSDYELWARTEDIRRAAALPVTLAFARMDVDPADFPGAVLAVSEHGLTTLHVAQALPPPQFGEIALVDHSIDGRQHAWQVYTLSVLGDTGLELWRRMGDALNALAAPGEWWPHTRRLEACLRGDYAGIREEFRSQLLATRGQERERVRELLAQLEIDHKHAEALRAARERAHEEPAAWLEKWQELRSMAAELAALYWHAHQVATSIPATAPAIETETESNDIALLNAPDATGREESEVVSMLSRLRSVDVADSMDTTSYHEDRAVREASLASREDWQTEADIPRYKASNSLAVYFMDPEHPLSLAEAQTQLLRVTPGTALTMRIALGLWNIRRNDPRYLMNGRVAVGYDEILEWRGMKKHTKLTHPGTGSEQRRTDGYREEDKEAVREDFRLASRYYLRGKHTITHNKKHRTLNVDAPYLYVAFVSETDLWGKENPRFVTIQPGDWIGEYENVRNHYLAEVDRRIFQLNPQNEQHELKIALYLTERWRELAHNQDYARLITMADLLRSSVIAIDAKHLTDRFIPRIEHAIEALNNLDIGLLECLDEVDKTKSQWGKAWLAARWRLLPPTDLTQRYREVLHTKPRQLPPGRKGH